MADVPGLAFLMAAEYGRLDMMRWLAGDTHMGDGPKMRVPTELAYQGAERHGQHHVMEWLRARQHTPKVCSEGAGAESG